MIRFRKISRGYLYFKYDNGGDIIITKLLRLVNDL
jgi:hypothetical protein